MCILSDELLSVLVLQQEEILLKNVANKPTGTGFQGRLVSCARSNFKENAMLSPELGCVYILGFG